MAVMAAALPLTRLPSTVARARSWSLPNRCCISSPAASASERSEVTVSGRSRWTTVPKRADHGAAAPEIARQAADAVAGARLDHVPEPGALGVDHRRGLLGGERGERAHGPAARRLALDLGGAQDRRLAHREA